MPQEQDPFQYIKVCDEGGWCIYKIIPKESKTKIGRRTRTGIRGMNSIDDPKRDNT